MTTRGSALFVLLGGWAIGQTGFHPPRLGCIGDEAGALHWVWGIRANFLLAPGAQPGATAVACSASHALLKTDEALVVLDQDGRLVHRREAAPGGALFAFEESGRPAYAYLVASRQTFQWRENGWEETAADWGGELLALSAGRDGPLALIRLNDELALLRASPGGEISVLGRVSAPASAAMLWPDQAMLLADQHRLIFRTAHGAEQRHELPGRVTRLSQMGQDWVYLETEQMRMAAYREAGSLQLYLLPGAAM